MSRPRTLPPAPPTLALDPSSAAVGYAFAFGGVVVRSGVLPLGSSKNPDDRLRRLRRELPEFLAAFVPAVRIVVVEVPGTVGYWREDAEGKKTRGQNAAIATCARAAGTCEMAAAAAGAEVVAVIANHWIGGLSKDVRRCRARNLCPAYDAAKDRGADESDAIALLGWHLGAP